VIQLSVLSGRKAGAQTVARRFPFRIGRAPSAHLALEDEGVWERHLEIHLERKEGFILNVHRDAWALVNGQPVRHARLRNGDLLECGSAQIRFHLSPPRQKTLRLREVLTWISLILLCLGQVALIYWLPG
jgi:pSer/pThr/pTyr-binding forkhead associated (FHA) protein